MLAAATIRVVLTDDHAMVREALARILEETARIRVVGQAANGPDVLRLAVDVEPDVVVLDYSMPGLDGLGTLAMLRKLLPQVKVVMLTIHESIHYAVRALESGALGYVVKAAAAQELVDAIQAACEDEVYISPKVSQKVIQHLRRPKKDRVGLEALSQREFELLRILGSGVSLKECADVLAISTSAASTYRARLMEKLNLRSTAELIRFAIENDIVG
jgi:DNA-binding NarL/FixJ family response regulator